MITCIINGMAAYPAASQSIKLTYANQYVTDDGEYSYDINFPMAIMPNRRVFHNVSRFDVSKSTQTYNDCKLYVSGRLVLSGVGTIISVTDSEIKLQIVGGKSRIKFNDKMTKHYIDEIDFGKASAPGYTVDKGFSQGWKNIPKVQSVYRLVADQSKFLGEQGKWCFMPVRDETNDMIANFVGVDRTGNFIGSKDPYISNVAVQPNLMYIFKRVIAYEGYTLTRNDLDVSPWNLLYIASAFKTLELRRALPHWTSYTFIEEFRKLFNATIYFDDIKKTCQVIKSSELSSADSVEIETLDEYTTDYDADGSFSTSSTANLQYNLGDSANRGDYEVIPKKVFDNFDIVDSLELAVGESIQFPATTSGWSEKKKRTTIIRHRGSDYYIYVEDTDGNKSWQLAGIWSPLIRDESSDDYTDLNISPAAQVVENVSFRSFLFEDKHSEWRCLLSMPNDKEAEAKESDTDEDGYNYVSIQDAIDDESTLDDSEDDQECMNVFFIVPGKVQKYEHPLNGNVSWVGKKSRWPQFMTDSRINSMYRMELLDPGNIGTFPTVLMASLSLNKAWQAGTCLGELHDSGLKIDNKNCLQVKFQSDTIPDPSHTYIIHNKKFVCEKIEMEVKDDQIEPIYTGYFYMMS
nr:MAG TPA: hypothetical protein [Caudoviricetes sp.]